MENEAKVSVIVAAVLVLTALYDLRISAGLAAGYLIVYAIRRLRKRKTT